MLNISGPLTNSGRLQILPKADMLDKTCDHGLYALENANNNANEIELFRVEDYKNGNHSENEHLIDKGVGTSIGLLSGNTIAKVVPFKADSRTENANGHRDGIQQLTHWGYTNEYQPHKDEPIRQPIGTNQPHKDEPIHQPTGTNNGLSIRNNKAHITATNVDIIVFTHATY
nr:hypothetical protein [Tanacetum cinerariifolium]